MAAPPADPANPVARYDRVYDLYRNCVLNELYYGHRLNLYSRIGLWLEIVIVVGSGTSGVSGWFIWTKYPEFAFVWGIIAAASTLLAALKPVIHIDTRIRRYSTLFAAYRQLALSMRTVVDEISEKGGILRERERDIDRIRKRYHDLSGDDDPRPSRNLVLKLQNEVNVRAPPDSLFYPPAMSSPAPRTTAQLPSVEGDVNGVDTKIDLAEPWPGSPRGKRK